MTGQAESFILSLEQLQRIRPVGQMAGPALSFFERRMGHGISLGLFFMA